MVAAIVDASGKDTLGKDSPVVRRSTSKAEFLALILQPPNCQARGRTHTPAAGFFIDQGKEERIEAQEEGDQRFCFRDQTFEEPSLAIAIQAWPRCLGARFMERPPCWPIDNKTVLH